MTKSRTLAMLLAAGTFGGTIGALATAAVQSQASPAAIAAAVQRVQDSRAEHTLQSIEGTLKQVSTSLGTLPTIQSEIHLLRGNVYDANYRSAQTAWQDALASFLYLQSICRNTAQSGSCQTVSSPPAPQPPPLIP
jgi:hypothetical protein